MLQRGEGLGIEKEGEDEREKGGDSEGNICEN